MSERIIIVQSYYTKDRLSTIFEDSAISFHSLLTRFMLPGRSDLQTYFVLRCSTFLHQPQSTLGINSFLSDHSQESANQLDSTKPMLATPVNAVMSLWGVKELVMRADRLEN